MGHAHISLFRMFKHSEQDEPVHLGGYRESALMVNVDVAKPIVWYRRWYQIMQAQAQNWRRTYVRAGDWLQKFFITF